jgi:lysyl-tRNA synthetase class 2
MLLLVARGLARRKRRAWMLAVVLLAGSSVFHLLKGLDFEEALIVATIALALVARRQDFNRIGDRPSSRRALARLAIFVTAIYTYGLGALLIRHIAGSTGQFSVVHALAITTRALVSPHLPANERLSQWFPLSLSFLVIAGVVAVTTAWFAPWRFLLWQSGAQHARARALVRRWGSDSLAPFTLRADKSFFFDGTQDSFLAYTVANGVAFVSGDPVGPAQELRQLLMAFLDFSRARAWQIAILGASERYLDLYRELGLQSLYWGDEAVVDAAAFSLEGRAIRKTRQSVNRLERAGFTFEARWAGNISRSLAERLIEIDSAWRKGKPSRGGTMTMDDLFHLRGREALFVIGRNADGEPCGFLHFVTCRAGATLSLSCMPHIAFTPNGFNEWLIVRAIEWARANGFQHLSLNFSPFARIFGDEDAKGMRRITREALLVIKSRLQLQLDNLYLFNQKFLPQWCPRYVVYERRAHLPRIGVAALAAEGYLRRGAV